jgi:iduronate 2-sulfatase
MTNFEVSTRVPMILSSPDQRKRGKSTNALSELVDIYPTLCELCGLPTPDNLEGTSMAPLLDKPNRKWKSAAFSQYPRRGGIMGHSMRTNRYRYAEWRKKGKLIERELYDYKKDPNEDINLAELPEKQKLASQLSEMLAGGWKDALPPGDKRKSS